MPKHVRETTRVQMGTYRGLNFGLVIRPEFPPEVYLEGKATRNLTLSREHQVPRAVLNVVERLASEYGAECDHMRQNIAIAEGQLRDNRARLGKSFQHEAYLAQLTGLRDQLKDGLSGKSPDGNSGPGVSDLADQIKSLKAGHSVDAAPQRVRQQRYTAEEPVTARIRRRAGAALVPNHADINDATPELPDNPANTPPPTFQERIAMERRHQDPEPSLP